MRADRLNAFTDGVIAIIITIMVLEIRLPEEASWDGFLTMAPFLGIYALSFVNIGIFWNNHHHMMQAARHVNGAVLWANLALLFWISLIPLVIRWIDEAGITPWPVATYGLVLIGSAVSYLMLERALIRADGEDSKVQEAVGAKSKEWLSSIGYVAGVAVAFVSPYVSVAIYVCVAIIWLVPDRRFERQL